MMINGMMIMCLGVFLALLILCSIGKYDIFGYQATNEKEPS